MVVDRGWRLLIAVTAVTGRRPVVDGHRLLIIEGAGSWLTSGLASGLWGGIASV